MQMLLVHELGYEHRIDILGYEQVSSSCNVHTFTVLVAGGMYKLFETA